MSKKDTDILQIKKYLSGELDAQTMHQLERQAQDDPFLMAALEGYENAGSKQQVNLDALSARLKERIEPKKVRIIPWNIIGIAASILVVCSIGVWWLNNKQAASKPETALAVKPAEKIKLAASVNAPGINKTAAVLPKEISRKISGDKKLAAADKTVRAQNITEPYKKTNVLKQAAVAGEIANADIKDSVAKDTTPVDEMIVTGYTAKKKKDVSKTAIVVEEDKKFKDKDTVTEQLLAGQAAGVAANNINAPKLPPGVVPPGQTARFSLKEMTIMHKNYDSSKRLIKGRVIANDDGLPLAGVTVKIAGTNIGTQTDANGYFNLSVDSTKTSLVVGYIGYETRKINANNRDSVKAIALKPNNNALAEVVVTQPQNESNTSETIMTSAHPKAGWSDFKKYLKKNAVSPDGKTGAVKLEFMVAPNGNIRDITIKKGLSPAADQKTIDLINNGPAWAGNTNGEPEKVSVRVKFVK